MGRVDLFHSRRTNYLRCEYWVRDERDQTAPASEWVVYNQPSGVFYARFASPKSTRMDAISGVWAFDSDSLTLETDDHIDDISRGSLIRLEGEFWIVDTVQRVAHLKESEYARRADWRTTLAVRRG